MFAKENTISYEELRRAIIYAGSKEKQAHRVKLDEYAYIQRWSIRI